MDDAASRNIDPERDHAPKPFDRERGYSGQDYRRDDEAAFGRAHPSGEATNWTPDPAPRPPRARDDDRDLPPDVGERAWSDPSGTVHGSGAGDGGGAAGEDYDDDAASGDGDPVTGPDPNSGEMI